MRIVLVGGGTGGHFYPLMAVAEAIRDSERTSGVSSELIYMGPEPYDMPALQTLNIGYVYCPAGKQRRYRSFLNFLDIFKVFFGIIVALWKLFIIYPDAIMSKGGYTSVPVVIAGWILRIPIVVHESDAVPGRANKIGARFAKYIAISYEDVAQFFPKEKLALTGLPIRKILLAPAPQNPAGVLGIDPTLPLILILGGSLGAERVNTLILDSLDELLPSFNVIHQTGTANFETVKASALSLITNENLRARYHPVAFIPGDALNAALHTASIVISRAGSGTIFEVASHGKPSILIPIPEEISHDQRTNAYAYARRGGGSVLEEENLRDGLLIAEISRIMGDPEVYKTMSTSALAFAPQDASAKIADLLRSIYSTH